MYALYHLNSTNPSLPTMHMTSKMALETRDHDRGRNGVSNRDDLLDPQNLEDCTARGRVLGAEEGFRVTGCSDRRRGDGGCCYSGGRWD